MPRVQFQGAGKSSLANSFLGWTRETRDRSLPFHIGHGVQDRTSTLIKFFFLDFFQPLL
jgi:hypothetical protein